MRELEIYLPMARNDGTPIDPKHIEEIKGTLVGAFGGCTHLQHRSEGSWRMGGVTFRDAITIIRVLDDGSARFDVKAFQASLAKSLEQEQILIVAREVSLIGE